MVPFKIHFMSKLLVVNFMTGEENEVMLVIDFSPQVVPLAAFFTFFEVTNLAFRRLGNRDAGGCSPFPKTQMTLRFEKVNFNALIEVAKKWLLTCYCIY